MIKFELGLVPYGFEVNFPDGFVCRDFADDYNDAEKLKLAAKVAIITYFETVFEKDLDNAYKFLQDKENEK